MEFSSVQIFTTILAISVFSGLTECSGYFADWSVLGARDREPMCKPIPSNLTLCHNIGYTKMRLPNLLDHDTIQEVSQQAQSWVPLLNVNCHPDSQLFLCSLFAPVCLERAIYPCRSLCTKVKDGCESTMSAYGFPWPAMLDCDKFPPDNDMCITSQNGNSDSSSSGSSNRNRLSNDYGFYEEKNRPTNGFGSFDLGTGYENNNNNRRPPQETQGLGHHQRIFPEDPAKNTFGISPHQNGMERTMPHQNGVDMVPPHQNQETLLIPGEEEEEACNLCRERPKPLKADEIMRNYCDADFVVKMRFKKTRSKVLIGRKVKSVFKTWRGTPEELRKLRRPNLKVENEIEGQCCSDWMSQLESEGEILAAEKTSKLLENPGLTEKEKRKKTRKIVSDSKPKFLVMGKRKENSDLAATFIMPWTNNKELKKARRMFKQVDCGDLNSQNPDKKSPSNLQQSPKDNKSHLRRLGGYRSQGLQNFHRIRHEHERRGRRQRREEGTTKRIRHSHKKKNRHRNRHEKSRKSAASKH